MSQEATLPNSDVGADAAGHTRSAAERAGEAVLLALYRGLVDPENYQSLFSAWDAFTEEGAKFRDAEGLRPFEAHFENADRAMADAAPRRDSSPEAVLARMGCPAAVLDRQGAVLHANLAASALGLKSQNSVFDLNFVPQAEAALRNALRSAEGLRSAVLRCHPIGDHGAQDQPEFLLADPVPETFQSGHLLLRSIRQVWTEDLAALLTDAFAISPAELALLEALFEGESLRAYAKRKGRREPTVRSQLSALLFKSGTTSQTALLRLVTSLAGMTTTRPAAAALIRFDKGVQTRDLHMLEDNRVVEVVTSGDPHGAPLIFAQTSTAPTWTPDVVLALAKAGVRLISPVKAGAGRSSLRADVSHGAWAQSALELADRLELARFGVGGQCSGGLHALALTAAAQERARACLLVDVGAPMPDVAAIYDMPPSPRRHHLASRFMPGITLAPIRYMAADMARGPEGLKRAISYFYTDSPTDEAALRRHPDLETVTIDNLLYGFENIPQLVADVAAWSRDASAVFEAGAAAAPLVFFHGRENHMMRPERIEAWCAKDPSGRRAEIVDDVGQLLVWQCPHAFAALAAEIAQM